MSNDLNALLTAFVGSCSFSFVLYLILESIDISKFPAEE